MKKILLLCIGLLPFGALAQQDAWVYFNAKENVQASIDNPSLILTQQAIDRKNAYGIVIDARDVPVNEAYITLLKAPATGITVLAKSKWFNAVYVQGSTDDINALVNDFDFVETVVFADDNLNPPTRLEAIEDKFAVENTTVVFNYGNTLNQIEMINADALHLQDYTGEGIIIAVLDSGFTNVDDMGAFQRLRDNGDLLGGYDFVDRVEDVYAFEGNDHGTRVLSNMAGFVPDQFVGTAPDASYYLFRTEDVATETPVEEAYWVEAAERSDSLGVHIINSSLGYKTYQNPNYSYMDTDLDGQTAFITRGANIANEKGIIVVTSAGNSGVNGVGAPADAPGAMSIGAVDADGIYVSFSSQGSAIQPTQKPDVVARGGATFVINSSNDIVNNNGTSFSSPIMAGGIASLWQALPNSNHEEIKQFVRMSASQFTAPDFFLGYGIPDLQVALDIALSLQEEEFFEFKVFPNPANDILNIQVPSANQQTTLKIYDILGKTVLEQTIIESSQQLDISFVAPGLYVMSFESGTASKTFKLIKS
ncbi:Por secretion system C-terminal sorting domain-containing protein [Formosa sp. Hel1_31_208]|uniref:S8 family serine peptidase n=1 Tax=Formosa sp. Hel1_31_208 TaxID=1798225 RepID=UPI00087A14D0|nr:S8 family serine peptidase [Formosa sp. Hel1_31_208]SDS70772.1 Por secretion system C-terminal sorting domain-containing protein [Formosa sp. Hel1_31_208]